MAVSVSPSGSKCSICKISLRSHSAESKTLSSSCSQFCRLAGIVERTASTSCKKMSSSCVTDIDLPKQTHLHCCCSNLTKLFIAKGIECSRRLEVSKINWGEP